MLKRLLFSILLLPLLACSAFAQGYWATYNYAFIPQQTTQGSSDYANIVLSQTRIDTALHGMAGFATNMAGMSTGLMKWTSSTGVVSTATPGTDYQAALVNPVTGTGQQYYLPYWTGTGTVGKLATAGTTGYYLVSNGSSAPPTWQAASGTLPTVTKYLSGSGTYTLPAGCLWIEVKMVGGGGGGVGSGSSGIGAGNSGTSTTFGGNTAGSGNNGGSAQGGGPGGTATLSTATGWYGLALPGNSGGSGGDTGGTASIPGGVGAGSPFGGGGQPGGCNGTSAGGNGLNNTGGGGGGGGLHKSVSGFSGDGGGSGGFIDGICTAPVSSYSYSVGVGGVAGSAGASGATGGTGGSGSIEIIEHYSF